MKKNVLLKTNIIICSIIIVGFLLTSFVSYKSNMGIFKKDVEHISTLTLEGIYHQIDSIFAKPIHISQTMANDNLLKSFLEEEESKLENQEFLQTMRDYLAAYKNKYDYDSVFLVSAKTNVYYHYESGVDRILDRDNPENDWYYAFLQSEKEYDINIDNDEVQSANGDINIFINCKILTPGGSVMGVVGVGFGVDMMQQMFQTYEDSFHLRAYLVDHQGQLQISTTDTGYAKKNLFENSHFEAYKEEILKDQDKKQSYWYSFGDSKGYMVTRYIPNLQWHLIIDDDTSMLDARINRQFTIGVIIISIVIVVVLLIITGIIRSYNNQIVKLTIETEKAHRSILQVETEKLYESIYEIDITHNQAASEETEHYFESLGIKKDMPYDKALREISLKQIKEEYREGYIRSFSPEYVMDAYNQGQDSIMYELMITSDHGYTYYWMRITARLFFWEEDQSVRMLVYHQNIDDEKQREILMEEKMQRDSLSGLYNKAATQERSRRFLSENQGVLCAFFIVDIDNFKMVNDTWGHAFGDKVIADFSGRIKRQFRDGDIVGRIGGDEFVVVIPIPTREWAVTKAKMLSQALCYIFSDEQNSCQLTASIGVAVSPDMGTLFETLYQSADDALYETKKKGKNGYKIFMKE